MAKAVESILNRVVGHFGLEQDSHGNVLDPHHSVHDGDTFTVRPLGNFGLRFLGIDTPEISFQLPGKKAFTSIDKPEWEAFLADPFNAAHGALLLDGALREHLLGKVGPGCAANHAAFAKQAQAFLEQQVTADRDALALSNEAFRLFLRFASDVVDHYGRLLAYVNRDQKEAAGRPRPYNERMLEAGLALPYFIWPNVDPFRQQASLLDAVWKPGTAAEKTKSAAALANARTLVAQARTDKLGVFTDAGLRLAPFELRFLAQRRRPNRWVIDLSSTGNLLRHPQRYFEIAKPEDRLYISEEHVAMFVAAGWVMQGI